MKDLISQFRTWIVTERPMGITPQLRDDEHILIETEAATAEVNLYPLEGSCVVELRITRASDDEPVFFLHFPLDDMGRAQELFYQMEEVLEGEATHTTAQVLLCCTSAMTTSMFAAKMGEAAKTLSLDLAFSAMPVEQALASADDYAAILLAPQVAYIRKQMVKAHPGTIVFEIPAKIFGSYDAGGAIRLLMHAFRELHAPGDDEGLRAVRDLADDRRILIVTLFLMRDYTRLGYKLYDHGVAIKSGEARKPVFDYRDIEDMLESLKVRDVDISSLDAIGIAVPGVTRHGVVELKGPISQRHDLGHVLSKRFGLPVYVDNNCNAAAVGCYVSQKEHESLVFYRHAFGHIAGGFGTVIDGRLLKGRANLAGEPKYFIERFAYAKGYEEALWTEEGMHEIARIVVLTSISLISPDAVYLAVDTVDDAQEFRSLLARDLTWEYVPPVYIVNDYVDRVYLGELAMCLQKLRDPHYRSLGVGLW